MLYSIADANPTDDFLQISEEDSKLVNLLKAEFKGFRNVFFYGCIIYLYENEEVERNFPHVSELLENYEKIYSKMAYTGDYILRNTKCVSVNSLYYVQRWFQNNGY